MPPDLPLFIFLLATLLAGVRPEISPEAEALIEFRRSVEDPLSALAGWDTAYPSAPCSWRGVICSKDLRVVALRLPHIRLAGPISSRLGDLSELRELSLRSNSFNGSIPPSFSRLLRLRAVFLQNNALSGPLPPGFLSNLTELQILNLAGNSFSGNLPSSLPPNLRYLDLSSNGFSGEVPVDLSLSPSLQLINLSSNNFQGTVPASIGLLSELTHLWLDWNRLEGTLPAGLSNCSSLTHLSLEGNSLRGILPSAIGEIPTLQVLSLSHNNFSGSIPSSIFYNQWVSSPPNLMVVQLGFNDFTDLESPGTETSSSGLQTLDLKNNKIAGEFPIWLTVLSALTVLDISGNNFHGPLPPGIGNLSALQELRLGNNKLNGVIPHEIRDCGSLQVLDLADNLFTGEIPEAVSELRRMKDLWLGGNLFSGKIPSSLANLSVLETLSLKQNNLSGIIPAEMTRMMNLTFLDVSENQLSGEIPSWIGNLRYLQFLNFSSNVFSGRIPVSIRNLFDLVSIDLSKQKGLLMGTLPDELFGLPNLKIVSLADNSFSGDVPEGFSSLSNLRQLDLSFNSFSGSIPETYGYLKSLSVLSLAHNNISGEIPAELCNCSELTVLSIRSNRVSGQIPPQISRLINLVDLDLGKNSLSGVIPPEISFLSKLQSLDLSGNNLSGTIPGGLFHLRYLNVSYNDLRGEIPIALASRFPDPSIYSGNRNLCGIPLNSETCNAKAIKNRRKRLILFICIMVAAGILTAAISTFCILTLLRCRRQSDVKKKKPTPSTTTGTTRRRSGSTDSAKRSSGNDNGNPKLVMFGSKITFAETLEATRQFSEETVLSRGRHGLVFKACYNDGTILSILRLPSTSPDGSIVIEEGFFRKEAENLGKIKHRNLTVLRGYYAGPPPDVRLLVYDYMPNGNLGTLLQEASHLDGHVLNWPMRHLIALGVSRGLAVLHAAGVIHGAVKPQSVLFDADFEPHLSEFGLDWMVATPVGPSVGYVAPEEGPTKEGDVYSFGVLLLELLTGKNPAGLAEQDEDLVKWVKRKLQRGQIGDLLEPGLLELDQDSPEWEEFLLGLKVGLLCTAPDPLDRPTMTDVVFMLEGCRVGPDNPSSADPTSPP